MTQSQQLEQILLSCLSHITVHTGTSQLLALSQSPTFLHSLLSTIFTVSLSSTPSEPLLIISLTTLKNYLQQFYNHKTTPLSPQQRQLIQSTIQSLYFKISYSAVAVNMYKEIVYILVAVSYPWQGLDLSKDEELEPNGYILEQVGVVYEYAADDGEGRMLLEQTIQKYFPMMENTVQQILQEYNQKTVKVMNCYLSMLLASAHMELPKYLLNFEKIGLWIFYLKTILNYDVVYEGISDHQNFFLKNQILVSKIFKNIIQQHVKDNSQQEHLPWVHSFISQFAIDMLETVISLLYNKKHVLHQDVMSNIIRTIYSGYKNLLIKPLIMPAASKIFEEMLPLIDYTNEDLRIFQEDSLEFIRRQEDMSVNPTRWEAIELVRTLIYYEVEGKSFMMRLIEYAAGVLKNPAQDLVNRKITVLFLISQLKTEILKNKLLKDQFGQLVSEYFFQYLYNENPILVYTTCRLFSIYLIQVPLDSKIVQQLVSKLFDCLSHQSIPVKFMSVLAFTSLIEDDTEAISFVRPHFSTILSSYLSLIQQIDHENLLKALEKMIKFFSQQVLSVGPKLIKHLINMFYKYADREGENDDEYEVAGFTDTPATGALNTIKQLLDVDLDKSIYSDASAELLEILAYVFRKNLRYCFDDVYELIAVLVYRGQQISEWIFPYLLFRKLVDGQTYQTNLQTEYWDVINIASKYVSLVNDSIFSVLKNLIVKMPREILFSYPLPTTPDLILCLVENRILTADQLANLNFQEVTDNWLPIIRSYVAVLYSINTVEFDPAVLRSFPRSISLSPWISTLPDLTIFITIIKKIICRQENNDDFDDSDQFQNQKQQNLTPLQMMQRLEFQTSDNESDYEDGEYHDEECCYGYLYDSPFDLNQDLIMIKEKLGQLNAEQAQSIVAGLGKAEYAKLMKLLNRVGAEVQVSGQKHSSREVL